MHFSHSKSKLSVGLRSPCHTRKKKQIIPWFEWKTIFPQHLEILALEGFDLSCQDHCRACWWQMVFRSNHGRVSISPGYSTIFHKRRQTDATGFYRCAWFRRMLATYEQENSCERFEWSLSHRWGYKTSRQQLSPNLLRVIIVMQKALSINPAQLDARLSACFRDYHDICQDTMTFTFLANLDSSNLAHRPIPAWQLTSSLMWPH